MHFTAGLTTLRMRSTSALLVAALGVLASLASATTTTTRYDVLHRISSLDSTPEWTLRATLDLSLLSSSSGVVDNTSSVAISHVLENKLTVQQVEQLKRSAYDPAVAGKWYQLALSPSTSAQRVGEVELSTSIPLCHLRQSHVDLTAIDDQLSLTARHHASSAHANAITVTGLTYRILDITLDPSSCPLPSTRKLGALRALRKSLRSRSPSAPAHQQQAAQFHTQLSVHLPIPAPRLTLKNAQPTNQDGTLQEPPKEKSLLQKYWFVLIPIALLLFVPDDAGRDTGAEAHPSSDHPGNGLGAKKLK